MKKAPRTSVDLLSKLYALKCSANCQRQHYFKIVSRANSKQYDNI